jgi:hypothetical protein
MTANENATDSPREGAPSDNTSLVAVLAGYADAGFESSFGSEEEDGSVRCDTCGAHLDPASIQMRSLRRLEGASDPDDMMAVVALECSVCGAAGTMVLGYGPMASAADSDVLRALRDDRAGGGLPGHAAPSETPDD